MFNFNEKIHNNLMKTSFILLGILSIGLTFVLKSVPKNSLLNRNLAQTSNSDLIDIYDGEKHQGESRGAMEFEAIHALQQEQRLNHLKNLITDFNDSIKDLGADVNSQLDQMDQFENRT